MVIYSGFGGQIVGETILSLGSRFLHMHSGHIPAYRGSTTLYYALLNGDCPTVTALFLDPCIDTGPIVARRTYAKPPAGVDIDHQYDSAIRADLLLRVLRTRLLAGGMLEAVPQPSVEDAPYYVIHPVLKHLAVLSLETQPDHA
jgi:methionyl-tRNA formyltransferase